MYSVTKRISTIKQPHGGYINKKQFEVVSIEDGQQLKEEENIHPSLVGLAVDYLTRYTMGIPVHKAFSISLFGATACDIFTKKDIARATAEELLKGITGLDEKSIINACKIVGYDVCFRVGMKTYKPIEEINPNQATIENIAIMVRRSVAFWEEYGPIIKEGFTFKGGYTSVVSSGDGDYLTQDTLWDFKVSKEEPKSKYTLQLLMYYLMGMHSIHPEFKNITRLGIFNPRKNKVYLLKVSDIPQAVIDEVSYEVIGYEKPRISAKCKLEKKKVDTFKIGDSVIHDSFGKGVVLKVEEIYGICGITVDFEDVGQKKIVSTYLQLFEKNEYENLCSKEFIRK